MSERPSTELSAIGENFLLYRWQGVVLGKELSFIIDRCVGCGLCVKACPTNAISLGPVQDVASGKLEAPLIMIDESKCVVCPLCSSICPTHALKVNIHHEGEYPKVKGSISVDREKCLPCHLCERLCPRSAIKAKVEVAKKEDLVKYETEERYAEGRISVDLEKCCFCGLCEDLCEALRIEWTRPEAPSFRPGLAVLVNEELCDYCGLCEEVCPTEAIKVECVKAAPRNVEKPRIAGSIEVDEDLCVYCGLCASVCPVDAISCERPFEGEVVMVNPDKCDPSGCKCCINICPTNAIYVSKSTGPDKVSAAGEACIYCGACEEACPEDALKVRRKHVRIEGGGSPWTVGFERFFKKVLEGYREPKGALYARRIELPLERYVPPPPRPMPPTPSGFEEVKRRAREVIKSFTSPKARILFERGDLERLRKELFPGG